jgi:hypothetical protein
LRPLAGGKGFELLNDFSGAQVQQGYRTKLFAAKSSCWEQRHRTRAIGKSYG